MKLKQKKPVQSNSINIILVLSWIKLIFIISIHQAPETDHVHAYEDSQSSRHNKYRSMFNAILKFTVFSPISPPTRILRLHIKKKYFISQGSKLLYPPFEKSGGILLCTCLSVSWLVDRWFPISNWRKVQPRIFKLGVVVGHDTQKTPIVFKVIGQGHCDLQL